ncbi:CIC11C00000000379 [Sungouiella intermedia]|uniref:CIC11C00000000379 n=1 Tax=Sungouiella intermedia TaxID=45354 RepID=A0A1L0C0U2_9ASCO|nr:CIC11C00000000379 [[Candida] intermedia]
MSLTELPYNVLDDIVMFSSRLLQLRLAQLNNYLRHRVNLTLYRNIMIVDTVTDLVSTSSTLVCTDNVQQFAACLNLHTFGYIDKIVVNTHGSNSAQVLRGLYEKLLALWNYCDHAIHFVNYDVLSLRSANSLDSYLAQNSLQVMDIEEENCIVTRKDNKTMNLRNWFLVDTSEFLNAPYNEELQQLNLYVESNAYGYHADEMNHMSSSDAAMRNLENINEVFLHSPLAYLKFTEMLDTLNAPRLLLKRLSVTCSHRVRNNAPLDFAHMNKFFDLNNLEELEIQLSCIYHQECSNLCMVKFFEDWKHHNIQTMSLTKLKKFALVNYKTMGEAVQFKWIVENYVLSPLFANLVECYFNYDLSSTTLSMDWTKVCEGLRHLPDLEVLHISKFVNDWLHGLLSLLQERELRTWEVMLNRCTCDQCCQYRSSFIELARADKRNHYNHKIRLRDIDTHNASTSSIDFNLEENVKYLRYMAGQLRKEEVIMEQNLHSTGTMLNMNDMPIVHNQELDPFREMLKHSCLEEVFQVLKGWSPHLRKVNFGGVVLTD